MRIPNRIELYFLIALIIALPLFEAPKNLLWLAFVASWFINRIRIGDFGGKWDIWDSVIAVWISSGYICAIFAGMHGNEWSGANDLLRYGSVLWLLKRSRYLHSDIKLLLISIIISTTIALVGAVITLYITHTRTALEMNSVGHVNHTAIYLTICYGLLLSFTLAYWMEIGKASRYLCVVLITVYAVALFASNSRAAFFIGALLTLLLGLVWLKRSRVPLVLLTTVVASAILISYFGGIGAVARNQTLMKDNNFLDNRGALWKGAYLTWQHFPLFGTGMNNYSKVKNENIKEWLVEAGKNPATETFEAGSHAHNLYLNTLAERGLYGTLALLSLFAIWAYGLWRHRPEKNAVNLYWTLWGGSFSTWIITIGIGFGNTTLHHEHGILSALLLGLWLSYLKFEQPLPAVHEQHKT